jgi:hypothetical protein
MARISKYELDANVTANDKLIGTDGDSGLETKNFSLTGVAEFIIDTLINPDATDFHVPVFNSNGTRLTDSIMHQDSSPSNGAAGTLLTVDGNFSIVGNTTLGTTVDDITTVLSTLKVRGKLLDKDDTTGLANQVLQSDANGYVFWGPEPGQGYLIGQGTLHYLPLWTPDGGSLGNSILSQDGDVDTPATQVTVGGKAIIEGDLNVETNTFLEGNVEVNGTTKLDTLAQDNTLTQVLVRDEVNDNILKWRDTSSIKPQVGFDTLDMTPDGWASPDGNFNAYVKLDDSEPFKSIKDMDWLVDGDRVVVIAENTKSGFLLPDDNIQFPNWTTGSINTVNYGNWDSGVNLGYPTSGLLFGEKIKFRGELYEESANQRQLIWDSVQKIRSANECPVGSNGTASIDENTSFTGSFNGIDDGYGGYGLTYSIVTPPANGTLVINDAATGTFTYTPNTNYFGTDTVTWSVFDGYCNSAAYNFVFTVNGAADAPSWTSTQPTYANLTGGDTWTYNWSVADSDTPCADLTFTSQTIPSWLTFTNNGNCTGTLTGTFPNTGGTFPVQLNVSDGTSTTSQNFDIGGLAVDNDTYFVNWFDGSGSMDVTGRILSQISSIPKVLAKSNGTGSGTTQLILTVGDDTSDVGLFVDDASGNAYNAFELIVDGMTVTGNGIVPGTTVVGGSTGGGVIFQLSNAHTCSSNDILTFSRTAAQKTADYNDTNTLRNLLQDFYATGQTQAQGNTDSATNGADKYDTHTKFGWDAYSTEGGGERQIQYLSNLGNPIDTSSGGLFENASTVVVMGWGDESSDWYYENSSLPFSTPASGTGLRVANDVAELKTFISNTETAAGNNQIYRGIWFSVGNNTTYRQIGQGLQNGVSGSQFVFPWTDSDLLVAESSGSPTRIQYAGQTGDTDYPNGITPGTNTQGYYRSVVLAKLIDSGFTTLS